MHNAPAHLAAARFCADPTWTGSGRPQAAPLAPCMASPGGGHMHFLGPSTQGLHAGYPEPVCAQAFFAPAPTWTCSGRPRLSPWLVMTRALPLRVADSSLRSGRGEAASLHGLGNAPGPSLPPGTASALHSPHWIQ